MICKKLILRVAVFSTLVGAFSISAATSQMQLTTKDGEVKINPMTGNALSEEQLTRSLTIARLQTQLRQEVLKHQELQGAYELSPIRLEVEKNKLKQSGVGLLSGPMPSPVGPITRTQPSPMEQVAPPVPAAANLQRRSTPGARTNVVEVQEPIVTRPTVGGISFGSRTIMAAAGFAGEVAKVNHVDVHATGAGTGLFGPARPQPLNNLVPVETAVR